jgi:hypothetical protein
MIGTTAYENDRYERKGRMIGTTTYENNRYKLKGQIIGTTAIKTTAIHSWDG